MPVTIYADTLIFINTFVTYFLLLGTDLLLHFQIHRLRILAASLLGGVYSLILLADLPVPLCILLRIGVCILIRWIADGFSALRRFIKGLCVFLLVNFVFAGLMLAVSLLLRPSGFLCSFGAVYFDVSIPFILALTLAAYGLIRLVLLLCAGHPSDSHYGTIALRTPCGTAQGKGIFDTGNHLCDSFTGKPVILVSGIFADPLVPPGVREFLHGKTLAECSIEPQWQNRLRLFPYSTVGGSGLLPAFRCDSVTLTHLKKTHTYTRLYIAVSENTFGAGEYDALFPCPLYEEMMEGESEHEIQNSGHPTPVSTSASAAHGALRTLHQRLADTAAAAKEKRGGRHSRPSVRRRQKRTGGSDRAQSAAGRLHREEI